MGLKGLFEAGFANRHIRLVFPSISLTLLFVTVFQGFKACSSEHSHRVRVRDAWMLKRWMPVCPNGTMHLQWEGLATGIHFVYPIQTYISSGH